MQRVKNLFQASFTSDMGLIKEMKKVKSGCRVQTELPDNVDGAEGEDQIVDKFRNVYSALYNSASTKDEVSLPSRRTCRS